MHEPDYSILAKLRPPTSKNNHKKSIVGQVFNRLTVYSLVGYTRTKQAMSYWLCRCKCGSFSIVAKGKLLSGRSKSCGCYSAERASEGNRTHGMNGTPEHRRWAEVISRVDNPNRQSAKYYVGRGIGACQGIRKFEVFYRILGPIPDGYQIDRRDNDGHYSCGECTECLSKN